MHREDVYALIDGERTYQKKWDKKYGGDFNDSDWAINDWIIFIERYVAIAKESTGEPRLQMENIRKIGALAVAAMEHNETEGR